MSERKIREKLQNLCEGMDRRTGRTAAPGRFGALLLPALFGAGLAVGACGDDPNNDDDDDGTGGYTSSAYGAPAYGVGGGGLWGGYGGTAGEGGAGGSEGGMGGEGGEAGGGGEVGGAGGNESGGAGGT